jgi:hypothetical protein
VDNGDIDPPMHTCETCGKEWPENYCPECGRTIGKAPTPAAPPPIPASISPPIPSQYKSAPAKNSFAKWTLIGLLVLAGLSIGGVFAYNFYKSYAFPPGYRNQPTAGWGLRRGEREFDNADSKINSFEGSIAFGNSPHAVMLARRFSDVFKAGRTDMFTRGSKLEILDNTGGEFMTFCELHKEECAFIVHVPDLRKFEKVEARKSLAQLAWLTAQKILKEQGTGQPKMELAVGLRGISQYGPIMLGYYDENANSPEDGLVKYLDDGAQTQFLWTFFAPESEQRAQ